MKKTLLLKLSLVITLIFTGCEQKNSDLSIQTASPSPTASPPAAATTEAEATPVTLPVLDALFADELFVADLRTKLQLTDEQIAGLRKIAQEEIARLRKGNAEDHSVAEQNRTAEASERARQSIREVIGAEKAQQLAELVREHWNKGSEEIEVAKEKSAEPELLRGPNAVPTDTRIVVNAPAFRMDVFTNGKLIKSYRIGIGYPEFPLPTGLRKAQTIIFNPTWTPPDSPWVATMKDVTAGEKVEAGSKLNPLGPIKIPIGMPSLIHGGKPAVKIGTFASHGCVGLTNAQVRDFVKVLGQAGGKEITDKVIAAYAKNPDKTGVIKLEHAVPVELRYETIVVEDGKLHIYRDVYDHNTNTEENLRAVLQANGLSWEQLSADEQAQLSDSLNAMSSHPKKKPKAKDPVAKASPEVDPGNQNENRSGTSKPVRKNQKEIVCEVSELKVKGYPAPVDLNTGTTSKAKPTPTPGQN
jgi:lipoprotein-anchoring transpeptidase ErfK/SrfK